MDEREEFLKDAIDHCLLRCADEVSSERAKEWALAAAVLIDKAALLKAPEVNYGRPR